jgi:hypothetical protein
MEILGATRGAIRIAVAGRTITLSGEGMPPGNPVDFYADLASIDTWEDGGAVSDDDRNRIIAELPGVALQQGFKVQID